MRFVMDIVIIKISNILQKFLQVIEVLLRVHVVWDFLPESRSIHILFFKNVSLEPIVLVVGGANFAFKFVKFPFLSFEFAQSFLHHAQHFRNRGLEPIKLGHLPLWTVHQDALVFDLTFVCIKCIPDLMFARAHYSIFILHPRTPIFIKFQYFLIRAKGFQILDECEVVGPALWANDGSLFESE